MPAAPPHRSEPSTARAARPPLSGGGGGGDDYDFDALAANNDDPMPAAPPHRSEVRLYLKDQTDYLEEERDKEKTIKEPTKVNELNNPIWTCK